MTHSGRWVWPTGDLPGWPSRLALGPGRHVEMRGLDRRTWLTVEESTVLRAALPRLITLCRELAAGPRCRSPSCTVTCT